MEANKTYRQGKHIRKQGMGGLMAGACTALCALVLYACGDKKAPPPNPATMPVPVNTFVVRPVHPVYYTLFPATTVATQQVDIRAEVEGYVTGIFFKEGEHVTKGQKLYSIDDSKYRASYGQLEANVKVAQANLEQAQKDADRYTFLNEHDAVAKQTLDHAMTTLQNAKSQVSAAKQDLSKAQTDLNYAIIKAPFDGTIGISQVRLGNTVSPGQTVLNTISSDDPMAVDFVVNEKQIPHIVRLQQTKKDVTDSIFTLQLADGGRYTAPGHISIIDRGVNPQTGTITIRLAFPNAHFQLRAGMSCSVRMRSDDTAMQLLIPGKAVVEQMGEYFVYVAKDTLIPVPDNGKKEKDAQPATSKPHALQRKVMLGQAIADSVIVKAGLTDGDSLITDGVQKLHDGSLIMQGSPAGKPKEH